MITGLKNIKPALERYRDSDGDETLENQEEGDLEGDGMEGDDEEENDDLEEGEGGLEE